jgi:hypothetical protein
VNRQVQVYADWFSEFGHAYIMRDPIHIARCFDDNAVFHPSPFDSPVNGFEAIRDFWDAAVATQDQINYEFDVMAATAEMGIVNWWASFVQTTTGETVELNGIAIIALGEAGYCTSFSQWWNIQVLSPETS